MIDKCNWSSNDFFTIPLLLNIIYCSHLLVNSPEMQWVKLVARFNEINAYCQIEIMADRFIFMEFRQKLCQIIGSRLPPREIFDPSLEIVIWFLAQILCTIINEKMPPNFLFLLYQWILRNKNLYHVTGRERLIRTRLIRSST